MKNLNNAACGLLAGDLPILEGGILAANRCPASDPEDTRSFRLLRYNVVKDQGGLSRHVLGVKSIFHEHEDIHIVGDGLRGYKGPKNDEPGQLPCATGQCVNAASGVAQSSDVAGCLSRNARIFPQGWLGRALPAGRPCRHSLAIVALSEMVLSKGCVMGMSICFSLIQGYPCIRHVNHLYILPVNDQSR